MDELRVNAKGDHSPWSTAVKQILAETDDLTQLYWVGVDKRRQANSEGLTRCADPRVTPAALGVGGETMGPRLQALLDVNRDFADPPLRPAHVLANRDDWIAPAEVEFYVDFETVLEPRRRFLEDPGAGRPGADLHDRLRAVGRQYSVCASGGPPAARWAVACTRQR